MKFNYCLKSLAVMAIFASCQNEAELLDAPLKGSEVTVTAVREGAADSRTTMTNENKINWHKDDKLSVFLGSAVNQMFTIHEGADTDYATFKGTGDIFITGGSESSAGAFANVAYYPYSEDVQIAQGANGAYTITTSLPSVQTYRQGSFGQDAYHMVAVAESNRDYAFTFKNVGSIFMLYLKGTAEITKIELESQANKLAGACTVTAAYGGEPSVVLNPNSAESKITLNCMSEVEGLTKGVQLNETESTVFVIAVPPIQGNTNDLTFTIYDANYGYMEYKNLAAYSVARNKYYTFGATNAVEYKATGYTEDYEEDADGNVKIYTAEGMKEFYDQLMNKANFSNKTVTLMADVDMTNVEWVSKTADGYTSFAGVFDGNNKTISNFKATTSASGGYATMFQLFSGEVKNLTMDGVTATDETKDGRASALVGYMSEGKLSGITIKNATVTGYQKVAGLVSHPCDDEIVIENCHIENVTLKANTAGGGTLWQAGGLAGYASGYKSMNITGCSVENITFENAATAEDCGSLPFYCHPFFGCIDYKGTTDVTVTLSNNTISGTNTQTDVCADASNTYYGYGKHRGTGKLTITVDGEQVWPALVAEINGKSYESLAEALQEAVSGTTVKVKAGEYTLPKIADGVTIEGEEGVVFTGTSSISGKNVTIKNVVFSNPDVVTSDEYRALTGNLNNATFENCHFDAKHGARYCYAEGNVVFNDCTFGDEECTRGVHFDGGSGTVTFNRCKLYGFNALGREVTKVTFKDCEFLYNKNYNVMNMYSSFEYNGCKFNPSMFTDCAVNGVVASYTNCSYTDDKDIKTLVRFDQDASTCKITFDGVTMVYAKEQNISSETLNAALEDGGSVLLTTDVEADVTIKMEGGVLDGNNKSISGTLTDYSTPALNTTGGTIQNLSIVTGCTYSIASDELTEDLYINSVTTDKTGYGINLRGNGNTYSLYAENCTFKGWSSFTGLKNATFTECNFGRGEYWVNEGYADVFDRLLKPYVDTVFEGCVFEKGFYLDLSAFKGTSIKFVNCKVGDTPLTKEMFKNQTESPSGNQTIEELEGYALWYEDNKDGTGWSSVSFENE